jgi:hypothetical protein
MGAPVSHQTVKLAPGSHRGPQDGACVLELASMLSHEGFSDRPRSVCPALREFLQGYNDTLPDELRQALLPLASEIVGSRSPAQVTAWRARLAVDWGRSAARLTGLRPRFGRFALANCGRAGRYCGRAAVQDPQLHERTVMFFRWLACAHIPAQSGGEWGPMSALTAAPPARTRPTTGPVSAPPVPV